MFLTKECDYAIRVVRALSDFERKTVKMIAKHEQVPYSFAYKILKKLERIGMVSSARGTLGGYQLAKKLDQITIFDIISAVNSNLYINECLKPGYICPHNNGNKLCSVHEELERIQDELVERLKSKTIDMLI